MSIHTEIPSSVVPFPGGMPADIAAVYPVESDVAVADEVDGTEHEADEPAVVEPPVVIAAATALISRANLSAAVKLASYVVERRNTIPILANALIRATDAGVKIMATDLDILVTVNVPGTADSHFATTLPAHMLASAAAKAASDMMAIDLPEGGGNAKLDFEGIRTNLQTLPAIDFPELLAESRKPTHRFTMPVADLCAAFRRVAFAISTEETRYYLNGVYMHHVAAPNGVARYHGDPGKLRLVATDGHRLGKVEITSPEGAADMPGVIVPRKTVDTLLKYFGAKPRKPKKGQPAVAPLMCDIEVGPRCFNVVCGNVRVDSKVIDGTFPEYGRVIPAGNDKIMVVDADEFAAAVDRVSTVSSERGRAVKFQFEADSVRMVVTNPDSGSSEQTLACDYAHEPMETGFNGRYMLDILAQFDGEKIMMKLADPGSPTLIQRHDGVGPLYVCMPMRV
jgi:DNA polymerase-3 subunit beta